MNGILIVDKPQGWTSHDVVGKLRGICREKRIGHGGTLDPLATGVLPIFIGRGTRAVPFCENAEKEYLASFRPGLVTDTQDITGTVLEEREPAFTEAQLFQGLQSLTGPQQQLPPMYSAVKIGGKKLYELARKGVEVERKPRSIVISSFTCQGREENGDYLLQVACSKGTYVRTLCHDLGQLLGCGGCMSGLRRVRAGRFTLADCVTLDAIQAAAADGTLESLVRPVDSLFDCPEHVVTGSALKRVLNGNEFSVDLPDSDYRVYDSDGRFLMLGTCSGGIMKTVKSFF